MPLAVPLALGVGAVALDVTYRARWSAGEGVSALLVFGARAPTHPFPPSPIPPAVEAETPGVQACGPGGSQVSSQPQMPPVAGVLAPSWLRDNCGVLLAFGDEKPSL